MEYARINLHSFGVTEQSDLADAMDISNKKLIINEDGIYQYKINTSTKMKVFVEFSDSGSDKEIAEEIVAILKNNYLKRIVYESMQCDSEDVQSTLHLEQGKEGTKG